MANCVTIGLDADNRGDQLNLPMIENLFTGVFLMEVVMRSFVYGFFRYYFMNMFAFMDLLLVLVTGVLISWILVPLGLAGSMLRTLQVL